MASERQTPLQYEQGCIASVWICRCRELIQSILSRSYTTAVGVFFYYVLLIGIANLIVDLLYPLLDPRMRL